MSVSRNRRGKSGKSAKRQSWRITMIKGPRLEHIATLVAGSEAEAIKQAAELGKVPPALRFKLTAQRA